MSVLELVPFWFIALYVCAVSAIIGSFLNVVIYRVPRGLSVVSPRSACPHCGQPIRFYDNVPLLSWLLLGGRCRSCRASISPRYVLVEALAAGAGVLALYRYGLTLTAVEVAVFAWVTIALGLIDLEHQLLPDKLTYPSIVFGLVVSWFGGITSFRDSLLGAGFGAGVLIFVIYAYRFLRSEEGMGWGDVKYLAAIGAVMGFRTCVLVMVSASLLGALFGIALIVLGKGSGKTALPFGTFLALAVLALLYLPDAWLSWIWW